MSQLVLLPNRCAACDCEIDAGDRFCRRCGASLAVGPPRRVSEGRRLAAPRAGGTLLENRLAIVGLLLVVGPLGLPFLWLSGRFSRAAKIITTIFYFGATVAAPLAVAWYWLEIAVRPLVEALAPALER